jgi:5-methylcytosine-specific restriction endonuclease McrA
MRRLDVPLNDPGLLFDACVAELSDPASEARFAAEKANVVGAYALYDVASAARSWHALPRCRRGEPDQVVVGTLTKGEIRALYSECMVASRGPARDAYDSILVAAAGRCPYCGGIGHAATLDHYLPKAYFPTYAVKPQNLIPSCQDCNKGLGSSFPTTANKQSLNPYYDDAKFFNERWIKIEFFSNSIYKFRYKVEPPLGWSNIDKDRALSHFDAFKLENRYAVEAAAEITNVLFLKSTLGAGYTPDNMERIIDVQARSPAFDLNGWRRTFYEGLKAERWFFENI